MAALSMSAAESSSRHLHAAVGLGSNMFVWGGRGGGGSLVSSSVVEQFNVPSFSWQAPRQLRGQSLPDGLYGMAVASDGDKAYCFGGFADQGSQLHNALYVVDLSSMQCREIAASTESPTARVHSAMVYYRRQLVLYGGLTGSTSDELFVFDLGTSESSCYYYDYMQVCLLEYAPNCSWDKYIGGHFSLFLLNSMLMT